DVLQHLDHVADVPVERVPVRDRLRERVLVAERDRDDGVERREEEDREPDDSREREQAPGPPGTHAYPALNFDQAWSQTRSPSTLSWSSSWFAANWSGRTTALCRLRGISPCLIRVSASRAFCGGV